MSSLFQAVQGDKYDRRYQENNNCHRQKHQAYERARPSRPRAEKDLFLAVELVHDILELSRAKRVPQHGCFYSLIKRWDKIKVPFKHYLFRHSKLNSCYISLTDYMSQ